MEQNQVVSGDLVFPISSDDPWLVIENPDAEEVGSGGQIFYNLNNPLAKNQCRIPKLTKKRIRGCNRGWVILSDTNQLTWSLWNPVTSEIILLRRLILKDGDYESIRECCLSAPPHDPSSVLLLTFSKKPSFVFCRLDCKRKRLRWIEMSYDRQLKRITGECEDFLVLHSLTCCNGKVYALNIDNAFCTFIIKVDIHVKDREVLIKLSLFGACPFPSLNSCSHMIHYLKGSPTELFYIIVAFLDKSKNIPDGVHSFKLDMTNKKCDEMEVFKDLDMTGKDWKDLYNWDDLDKTYDMWEEITDLKDTIFFMDVARDFSVFYCSAIASEFGGFIHIRGEIGNIVYSYHVKKKTISLSSMPFPVLSTSNNDSVWECWLEDNHGEPECISKQEEHQNLEAVVRSITDEQVELNKSRLMNLPFPILEMIMELCFGVEYMKFRVTCKHCHLAAPVVKWRNETTLRRLQNYSLISPWLVVADKNQGILTFTDPIFGDNYYMKKFHLSILNERIYCSRFGWLLFYSREFARQVFFNPFTSDLRKLPYTDYFLQTICFSAPPTSADCMVVGFSTCPEWNVYIHFPAGEPSWRRIFLGADPIYICFPTFYGQDLYALCNKGQLIVFKDLGKEDDSSEPFKVEATKSNCRSLGQSYLVKYDQHILQVIVGECGEQVELFKWNNSTWEKINSLGRHMIYICDTTCVCIEATILQMENKIFFPRLHSKNKKIFFYSLETCRYHTFNDKNIEESFGDFIGTEQHFNPHAWIEPSWS